MYPEHYVSLTNYPVASDIKPAHRILTLTHRKCRGKPDIRILPLLLKKNKYGRSQLYRDQIFSPTIYLYSRKFDWWLIVHLIWLVWHTYISDPLIHPPITYPTRRLTGIFLQKNNSKNRSIDAWKAITNAFFEKYEVYGGLNLLLNCN